MLVEALVVGGTLYAGAKIYRQVVERVESHWRRSRLTRQRLVVLAPIKPALPSPAVQQANQTLAISSAALGLAAAGWGLMMPLLSLVSLLLVLYVFAPTFGAAYRALIGERRVTNPVLDALRVGVCVVMGYTLAATLNAVLQAISQRLFAKAEDQFQREVQQVFGQEQGMIWAYHDGVETAIRPPEAGAGTVIALAVGDMAPADGTVLYGEAWLDQRIATGNRPLIYKSTGDQVVAASIIASGQLYVQLERVPTPAPTPALRTLLAASAEDKSWIQQVGEAGASGAAPVMLVAFALSLPLMGANRAAALLTTGFGAHLRFLGPHLVRHVVSRAARAGILIKAVRALEAASLVNTLVFDGRVLAEPTVRSQAKAVIHRLRQRRWITTRFACQPFAVYVLLDQQNEDESAQLVPELGLDDYFVEPLITARATLIERLQLGGRFVCYIGSGADDDPVMEKAMVAVAHRGLATFATNRAQVVLLDNDLQGLEQLFDLAATFTAKQGFNLMAPIGLDLLNLAMSVLLHFGLVYSLLFHYTGLFLGAALAPFPPLSSKQPAASTEPASALLKLK